MIAPVGDPPYRGAPSGSKTSHEPTNIWLRAMTRWIAVTVVMGAVLLLVMEHPYYRNAQFASFKMVYPSAFGVWVCVGLLYVKATLQRFSSLRYTMRDGPLHLVLLARLLWVTESRPPLLLSSSWIGTGVLAAAALATNALARISSPSTTLPEPVVAHLSSISLVLGATAAPLGCATLYFTLRRSPAWKSGKFWRVVKNRRVRTTLLAIVVKVFFTPLMIGFVVDHLTSISRAWLTHKHLPTLNFNIASAAGPIEAVTLWWQNVGSRFADFIPSAHDLAALVQPWTWSRADLSWGLGLAYDVVFAIDCGWALFGYASESRWLDNKTRSVEPTAFGWVVCLGCYPPFNNVLGTYLPLPNGPEQISSGTTMLALRAATVFLFAIYASATVSFGFRFSNLTNRGIVSRGPYRYVRHPAYLCKCSAWWLEHIPTITITKAFFLTLLCGVYALRAWTEERHLGQDPDYRAYKKKTPWVIFPGIY